VREALRLFCNGGTAPEGKAKAAKHVSGFGLDPKVLIKAEAGRDFRKLTRLPPV
jgi:hypothetical protein